MVHDGGLNGRPRLLYEGGGICDCYGGVAVVICDIGGGSGGICFLFGVWFGVWSGVWCLVCLLNILGQSQSRRAIHGYCIIIAKSQRRLRSGRGCKEHHEGDVC